jgi:hypothetical protein
MLALVLDLFIAAQGVSLQPVRCDCLDGPHGRVLVRGRPVSGDDAGDVKVAPDGTVGWIAGGHYAYSHGVRSWAPDRLVLFRGRVLRTLQVDVFVRDWRFWNGHVVVYSGPRHGPGWYSLIEIASGKVVEVTSDAAIYYDGKRVDSVPDWMRAFF